MQLSNTTVRSSLINALTLPADPTVIIFTGWGNAGKTNSINRALLGLSKEVSKVGVIINERSDASVAIDIRRLPTGFEKVGLQGCSCCSQLPEVLNSIKTFKEHGRVHTMIEQGHLSVASDLRSGLAHEGHRSVVVYLFNPLQYVPKYQCVQFRGIRGADIIVLTHCRTSPELAERGANIVDAVTADLRRKPTVFVDSDPTGDFNPKVWENILSVSSSKEAVSKQGWGKWIGGLLGGAPKLVEHDQALMELRGLFSEESFVPYITDSNELVSKLMLLRQSRGLEIERVKGFLAGGIDINIEWTPKTSRYNLSVTEAPAGASPVLAVRTLQGSLRKYIPEIVRSFATPDVNPDFIASVASSYPDRASIHVQVRAGNPPLAFESDRLLTDLVNCRFCMNDLMKVHPDRFNEMCEAIIQLQDAALVARIDLLHSLAQSDKNTAAQVAANFNARYFILEQLSNENLHPFRAHLHGVNHHPFWPTVLGTLGEDFTNVAYTMPQIRFEGRKQLTRSEVESLISTFRGAHRDALLSEEQISKLINHWLSPKFMDTDLKVQKDLLLNVTAS